MKSGFVRGVRERFELNVKWHHGRTVHGTARAQRSDFEGMKVAVEDMYEAVRMGRPVRIGG